MSWQDEVDEIKRRVELAKQMGGPANVERQHASGKLTVRERIDRLVDPGSFHEIGALAGKATYEDGKLTSFIPSNYVVGTGRIEGRRVVVGGGRRPASRAGPLPRVQADRRRLADHHPEDRLTELRAS